MTPAEEDDLFETIHAVLARINVADAEGVAGTLLFVFVLRFAELERERDEARAERAAANGEWCLAYSKCAAERDDARDELSYARARIEELEGALREACDYAESGGPPMIEIAQVGDDGRRYAFNVLRARALLQQEDANG